MLRPIVIIDQERCDGCGECLPACREGALEIVDGKASVVADRVCDGMGACLGTCPRGALRIEQREADEFDPQAVAEHLRTLATRGGLSPSGAAEAPAAPSCPGAQPRRLAVVAGPPSPVVARPRAVVEGGSGSELRHWPVKLRLLAPDAPVLRGASLVVTADCTPVALPDFHQRLLRGRAVVLACPKFEARGELTTRLGELFARGGLSEVTVARMVVPCCSGLTSAVVEARDRSGVGLPVTELVVGLEGEVVATTALRPAEPSADLTS
jgi:NAD-dependent dihydropyrimidine dehydrogenase PreA subunit